MIERKRGRLHPYPAGPPIVAAALVAGWMAAGVHAQESGAGVELLPEWTYELTEVLPEDPAVRTGQLDNGLRYYVRKNGRPENRAFLRLVVRAGSVLEDDDQLGLAHFVEHMAFNGTEHFEKAELLDYLQGIGMRFGADVNAYTSFDETVYMLEVPTDDPDILDKALLVLEDWASAVTLDDEEIERERGVVIEEWRGDRGAGARLRDAEIPYRFHGSRYAERLPIGDPEMLREAPPDRLRDFYRDWYRPDLMAIIAVGDFDPEAMAADIRQRFAGLEGPDEPRERLRGGDSAPRGDAGFHLQRSRVDAFLDFGRLQGRSGRVRHRRGLPGAGWSGASTTAC